jgi:3-deoxy-manno-octulosonate cytidylyltransferase (CMP-KDO synthetase)
MKSANIIGVIPARLNSTRLPNKPLVDVNGVPLVIRVWQNIRTCKTLNKLFIATDAEEVANVCEWYGADYVMTAPELPSGTDRCYVVAKLFCEDDKDIVVNIQGDEPLLRAEDVDALVTSLQNNEEASLATLITRILKYEELCSPNNVKVVLDNQDFALYFSRSPIPYMRDYSETEWLTKHEYWKHIGIYAYRFAPLKRFVYTTHSLLENIERLEQLRALQNGERILCVRTEHNLQGIDTPEDLAAIRLLLK